MATGRVPTTANSPLTAKGDLFTYSTAPARLAVGNNGESLVADSSTSTGLRYQSNFAAGKNAIINGAFNVWQRGTSFTPAPAGIYTADRFMVFADGTGGTRTVSQQTFTPGTAPVAGYESQYYMRYATTVAPTGQGYNNLTQRIEDVRTFAGQTVTVSFWAKTDAAKTYTLQVHQNFGSGGSTEVYTGFTPGWTTTTSWARYSYSFTMPSISGKTVGTSSFVGIQILLPTTGTYTLEFWGLQLEAGSVATAFQTATGTLQGELAACQRYYYLHSTGSGKGVAMGTYYSGSDMRAFVGLPVTMRTTPTLSAGSGTNYYRIISAGVSTDYFNSFTLEAGYAQTAIIQNSTEVSGTAGYSGIISCESGTNSFVAFSAEL